MEFQEDFAEGYQIQAYGPEGIQINDEQYTQTVIVCKNSLNICHEITEFEQLHQVLPRLIPIAPEIVLIGTGNDTQQPHEKVYHFLIEHQLAFEFMNTGAACRTYNVLLAEGRRVCAILIHPK